MAWDKKKKIGGCAWVLRDHQGVTILHSRRGFTEIASREDLNLKAILWTIESMHSHKINKVIFGSEVSELVQVMQRPKAWPSYSYHFYEMHRLMKKIKECRLIFEHPSANRGAFLIAQSATRESLTQSYVAGGHPFWLQELFDFEKNLVSV